MTRGERVLFGLALTGLLLSLFWQLVAAYA